MSARVEMDIELIVWPIEWGVILSNKESMQVFSMKMKKNNNSNTMNKGNSFGLTSTYWPSVMGPSIVLKLFTIISIIFNRMIPLSCISHVLSPIQCDKFADIKFIEIKQQMNGFSLWPRRE